MNFQGVLIGLFSFLIIGLFHPIVIKCEYHFSYKIWPVFLFLGLVFTGLSLISKNVPVSILLGITGFTCWWTIKELFEQRKRVEKGWFPKKNTEKKR